MFDRVRKHLPWGQEHHNSYWWRLVELTTIRPKVIEQWEESAVAIRLWDIEQIFATDLDAIATGIRSLVLLGKLVSAEKLFFNKFFDWYFNTFDLYIFIYKKKKRKKMIKIIYVYIFTICILWRQTATTCAHQ